MSQIPTIEQIHAMNNSRWQAAKEFGERHGFGFMIQVATTEWIRTGHHTRKDMAFWLRTFADTLEGTPPALAPHPTDQQEK